MFFNSLYLLITSYASNNFERLTRDLTHSLNGLQLNGFKVLLLIELLEYIVSRDELMLGYCKDRFTYE